MNHGKNNTLKSMRVITEPVPLYIGSLYLSEKKQRCGY